MTKRELKEYRELVIEKNQLAEKLKELREEALDIGSPNNDGMPPSGHISSITEKYAVELAAVSTALLMKKHEILCAMSKIETAIEKLKPLERALMREYYINGLTWEEVCVKLSYGWAQTHRIHARALKNMI